MISRILKKALMSELLLQINQTDLSSDRSFAPSCNKSKQEEGDNFDDILKSISKETVEVVSQKESSSDSKVYEDKVSKLTTREVDECIELRPKDISLDVRCELDDALLCIADQNISGVNEDIESEVCKLNFPLIPVELHYEISEREKGEVSDNHLANFNYGNSVEDIDLLKVGEKVELSLPKIHLKFSESVGNNQSKKVSTSNLPVVSSGVDTKGVVSSVFKNVNLEFSESISSADYQYGYENYYNNTKVITEGRINFSLDSLEAKLINQVKFSISKAASSKENNTIVQLEPAELGKIEIIVSNQGKERNIVINSDKISTFELLRKHSGEFLNNIKFSESESDVTTNLSFSYKDLSDSSQKEHQTSENKSIMFDSENDNSLTGWGESRMSVIFLPYNVDKNVDVWV